MSNWFCHSCQVQLRSINQTSLTCPHCHSEFIEAISDSNIQPFANEIQNPALNTSHNNTSNTSHLPHIQLMGIGSNAQIIDLGNIFNSMAGGFTSQTAFQQAHSNAQNAFNATNRHTGESPTTLLNLLFNAFQGPVIGARGDFVFSQQGIDDIITQMMEAGARHNGPVVAPESIIAALPRIKFRDTLESKECSICQDDYVIDTELIQLPCFHAFHSLCITSWLRRNATCPVCRYDILEVAPSIQEHVDEEPLD